MLRTILALCALAILAPALPAGSVLLIPNAVPGNVWAFSPQDGSLVNSNLIPADGRMATPKNAIDSGRGTILVSDQVADSVFEYAYDGTYIGLVAGPAQGLDNLRGIAVRDGYLHVTVAGGALIDTVQRFKLDGASQNTWTSAVNPFDIFFRAADALVSSWGSANILRFDLNGNPLGVFSAAASRPEQIQDAGSSNLLVADFTDNLVHLLDAAGAPISSFAASSARGVYLLGNGDVLWTNSSGVYAHNLLTGVDTTIATGSFHYIELANGPAVPEPASLLLAAAALSAFVLARRRR